MRWPALLYRGIRPVLRHVLHLCLVWYAYRASNRWSVIERLQQFLLGSCALYRSMLHHQRSSIQLREGIESWCWYAQGILDNVIDEAVEEKTKSRSYGDDGVSVVSDAVAPWHVSWLSKSNASRICKQAELQSTARIT